MRAANARAGPCPPLWRSLETVGAGPCATARPTRPDTVMPDVLANVLSSRRGQAVRNSIAHVLHPQRSFGQPPEEPAERDGAIVVAFHPQVQDIGHAILDAGGNAFDAFVAVAAAENVIAEGASTLAGPLGVLGYVSAQEKHFYLDADFNDPLDPDWHWRARMPHDGRAVLVPGAPA